MILKFAIQTVFEIALVVLIVYGFIYEDKLITFEDEIDEMSTYILLPVRLRERI